MICYVYIEKFQNRKKKDLKKFFSKNNVKLRHVNS